MDFSHLAAHLTSVFTHTGSLHNPCAALQPATTNWPAPALQQPAPIRQPRPSFGRFSPTYLTICREASKSTRAKMPIGSEVAARRRVAQAQASFVAAVAKPVLHPGRQQTHYSSVDIKDIPVGQPRCFFLPPVADESGVRPAVTQLAGQTLPEGTIHTTATMVDSARTHEVRRHTQLEVMVKGEKLGPLGQFNRYSERQTTHAVTGKQGTDTKPRRLTAVGHSDLIPPSLSRTTRDRATNVNRNTTARGHREKENVTPQWAAPVRGEEKLECYLCAQRCVGARAYYRHMWTHAP
ncbi:hypothetical protein PHLGIDRAFT_482454 [Phlebiopsis gigantea 11061_1 CR5-6]|uniref:Uncharacterized protein n=1 Tax=Phlebiopsis gigantea (strain 11061_1 CR5-6) TaxID=745531 RepID=A0A0C3NLK1_PHLG1|nr:hypothetical protein PHLGIDRAFT_482454 [Phlebiopsis gigantea 11061_1 CR5-6]